MDWMGMITRLWNDMGRSEKYKIRKPLNTQMVAHRINAGARINDFMRR
jgi:hypothetical protein